MQDNLLIHEAKQLMKFFEKNEILLTDSAFYSPSLNPIEIKLIYQDCSDKVLLNGNDDIF